MKKALKFLAIIIIIVIVAGFFLKGTDAAIHEGANTEMQHIKNQVADDAVKQYEIAKRQGDKMQIYVQAGMVSAAYLQAQDEENYKKWKAIEDAAGKDVGIK